MNGYCNSVGFYRHCPFNSLLLMPLNCQIKASLPGLRQTPQQQKQEQTEQLGQKQKENEAGVGTGKQQQKNKEGKDLKAKMLAQRLTPQELAAQEAYELEQERARRRIARKKFLPEERIDIEPIYNRVSSPQEYAQTGRWLNYYNNPQFTGNPIRF